MRLDLVNKNKTGNLLRQMKRNLIQSYISTACWFNEKSGDGTIWDWG